MSSEERKDNVQVVDESATARFRIGGRIVLVTVFLALTAFMGYLIKVQYGIQHDHYDEYSYKASQMHWQRIKDVPSRGDIVDRNGNILASTTYEYTIGITPSDVLKSQEGRKDALTAEQIADAFASIVGADKAKMVEWLAQIEKPYIQVIKKVNYEQKNELQAFLTEHHIGGVKIDSVPKRYYNYGSLGAQIIGFADQNDNSLIGQYGIEAQYNSYLTGTEGFTYAEVDNYNQSALPYSAPTSIAARDGYNVQLTLDMNIQRIAENACRDAYNEYKPKDGVTCIIMDPYTGEILAMVSMPDFDLNTPREKPYGIATNTWDAMTAEEQANYLMSQAWRNRCISDTYEPGSTMKAVTTAIAFEEGQTYEDEIFSDAPIEITSVDTISCWREKTDGNHGDETLREAFERSCNPIFVKLARRVGIEKYYDYIRTCGFYDVTGVDLPAEGKGIFHAKPTEVDLATLSFGESSTVTPLQLISVYSSLINGGSLMRPRIASRIVDNSGNIIKEFEPEKVRTLFSEQSAARVRSLLEDVVNEGTGSAGYVPGYYVAGKTSTSTIDVGDEKGMHVISFGCFAPSYDPKIAVLVVINKPEDKEVGSSAAAKVSARIVEETLEYMGVDRKLNKDEYDRMTILYHVPDVTGKTYLQAKKLLEEEGFEVLDGSGTMELDTIVGTMYYGGEETVYKDTVIVLYPGEVSVEDMNKTPIPDFTGMNIIEARKMAKQYGLNLIIDGNVQGRVVSQDPPDSVRKALEPTPTPTPTPDPDATEPPDEPSEDPPPDDTEGTKKPEDTGDDPGGEEGESTGETTPPPPTELPFGAMVKVKME